MVSEKLRTIAELLEALLLAEGELRLERAEAQGLTRTLRRLADQVERMPGGAPHAVAHAGGARRFKATGNVIFPAAFHPRPPAPARGGALS